MRMLKARTAKAAMAALVGEIAHVVRATPLSLNVPQHPQGSIERHGISARRREPSNQTQLTVEAVET